jgi:hypothetical protein
LALALGEALCGLTVEWRGHRPADLGPQDIAQAARLMLVDTNYRSATGWPAQLLRLPPHRWPAQVGAMLKRRSAAGSAAPSGEPGFGGSIAYAMGADGRTRLADAVRLSLWLRRR